MKRFTLAAALIIMIVAPLAAGAQTRVTYMEGKIIKAQDSKGLSVRDSDGTTRTLTDSDGVAVTGDLTVTGDISAGNDLFVIRDLNLAEYLSHIDDDNTYIRFTPDHIRIYTGGVEVIGISPTVTIINGELEVHVGDVFAEILLSSDRDDDAENIGGLRFEGLNDAGSPEEILYAGVKASIVNNANGSEKGSLLFEVAPGDGGGLDVVGTFLDNGYFGVGAPPLYRLHVAANRGANGDNYAALIANLGNNGDRYVLILQGGLETPASETTVFIDFRDGSGSSFATMEHDNGTLQIAQASGIYRLIQHGDNLTTFTVKKDITSTTLDATDIARRIAVFDYTLAEGGNRVIGQFTADQIEPIFPEMVREHTYQKTFVDDDGVTQTLHITQKMIQPLRLIPVLVKALQEQQAQIDENEANIAILEGNQLKLWLAVFGSLLLGGGFSELRRKKS